MGRKVVPFPTTINDTSKLQQSILLQEIISRFDLNNHRMKTADIRQKLHRYIETAKEKKVKAIFTMVEEEIEESNNHWNDEKFVAELQRRESGFLNGTTKTYALQQSVTRARQSLNRVFL